VVHTNDSIRLPLDAGVIPEGVERGPLSGANPSESRMVRGGTSAAKGEFTMTNKPATETLANIEAATLDNVAGGCGHCKNHTTVINNYGPRWGGPPPGYWGRPHWGGGMSVSTTTSIG
jgi:hypothetical protein